MRSLRGKAWLALLGSGAVRRGGVCFATTGRSQPGVPRVRGIHDPIKAADRTLSLELRSEHLSVQYVAC